MFKQKKKGLLGKVRDAVNPSPTTKLMKDVKSARKAFSKQYEKTSKTGLFEKKPATLVERVNKVVGAVSKAASKTKAEHGDKVCSSFKRVAAHTAEHVNKTAKIAANETTSSIANALKPPSKTAGRTRQRTSAAKIIDKTAQIYNAAMASDLAKSTDRWLRETFASTSDVYDKALDAARAASGQLGPDHRTFDGGHTLTAAWERVRDALPDDSMLEQIKGYVTAIKNDVITPEGLPVTTLDKDQFNKFVEITGVDKSWARDMAGFTATEVLGTTVGAIALALNWNKTDVSAFTKTASSLGVSSIAGANPLLAILSLSALAYDYQKNKNEGRNFTTELLKGAGPAVAFAISAGIVGGPAWVGSVAGVAACIATSRRLGDKDYDVAAAYIKTKSAEIATYAKQQKEKTDNLFSTFKEAQAYARSVHGATLRRDPSGEGYLVVLK